MMVVVGSRNSSSVSRFLNGYKCVLVSCRLLPLVDEQGVDSVLLIRILVDGVLDLLVLDSPLLYSYYYSNTRFKSLFFLQSLSTLFERTLLCRDPKRKEESFGIFIDIFVDR